MKYTKPTFTVPASAGSKDTCAKDGHAWADVRGKCVRCGAVIRSSSYGFNVAEGEES